MSGEDVLQRMFAENKIGALKMSRLPIAALEIAPALISVVFGGDFSLAVTIINEVAVNNFGLIIDSDGKIALPPDNNIDLGSNIQVLYKAPTSVAGIPPLPDNRPYRKIFKRDRGQE